jgi:hypothetical protein
MGGWVGPSASLDTVEKNLLPLLRIEPRPSSPWSFTILTELTQLLIKEKTYFNFKTKKMVQKKQ